MKRPIDTPTTVSFTCNICGAANEAPVQTFHRELTLCVSCRSTPRFRGIIYALSHGLFGKVIPLRAFPKDASIRGVGFADWPGYATGLSEKLSFQTTYYDRVPRIDITDSTTIEKFKGCNFVICSDIFEHIARPLEPGFSNLHALLKPGGLLVFSVPDTSGAETVEHFPPLHEYDIVAFRGEHLLIDRDSARAYRVFDRLRFHHGGLTSLEMRVFSQRKVLDHLFNAGFRDVKVHDTPRLDIGYFWPPLEQGGPHPFLGYIITARAR